MKEKVKDEHGNILKECSSCKIIKPLYKYHKDASKSDGRNPKCKECRRTEHKSKYSEKQAKAGRKYYLKRKYGLSLEDYNNLLNEQNNCCAICGKHQLEFSRRLAVDHSHITGNIRGLLCQPCNTALGKFRDSIDLLNSAIEYLKNSEE